MMFIIMGKKRLHQQILPNQGHLCWRGHLLQRITRLSSCDVKSQMAITLVPCSFGFLLLFYWTKTNRNFGTQKVGETFKGYQASIVHDRSNQSMAFLVFSLVYCMKKRKNFGPKEKHVFTVFRPTIIEHPQVFIKGFRRIKQQLISSMSRHGLGPKLKRFTKTALNWATSLNLTPLN